MCSFNIVTKGHVLTFFAYASCLLIAIIMNVSEEACQEEAEEDELELSLADYDKDVL